jgi:glucose/arabinose dehydrogenase/mono/diheme cytochrome c family protein
MKKIIAVLIILLGAAVAYQFLGGDSESPFALEEGYQYLYDGDSLAGWRPIGGQASFVADGEDILGRHGPGENTFLRTDKTFRDFSLKLQMRWDEPGNSGVMFRANQRDADGRVYGYQFELDPSDRAWSGGIYDEARRGWLANLENNVAAREAIRLDEWNDIEIEVRGARIQTWINGVPAADIIDGLTVEGFIALQVHAGNKGVMRWRRIRIREYPESLAPGDNLMKEMEWRMPEAVEIEFTERGFSGPLPEDDFWMVPRRQFKDAMIAMTVPACEEPTVIQMRYRQDESGKGESFAEVKVYADRAEGRLVSLDEEHVMDVVPLNKAAQHRFVGVVREGGVVLGVDEADALRIPDTGLYERGELRIKPARCGEKFTIADFDWFSLDEKPENPLFYQTLDNKPAPVFTAEEALGTFSLAPGFEIELVAAEPLVEDPVAMTWDEFGRLYVVEMRGFMPDSYGTGSEEPVGRVMRLEDIDGDGRMDVSKVFLGGLVNPRAVAVVNEGVLIGEPPNLWLCDLSHRDALCENKRRVGEYAADATAANVEHMENGLRQGLDNWLYNSKSSRRLRIEDGELIEDETLFRGQWGITSDDYGRLLYNHNSTWIQADLFAADDLLGSRSSAFLSGLGVNLTDPAEVYSVRVNPGVNRAYLEGTLREDGRLRLATGASGIVAYRGDQFPARYHNDVFVPEPAGNVVAQFEMGEDGLAMTASQRLYADEQWGKRGFLGSTDERFRPVDVMNGPDGALYIVDMYRGIIQDEHFLTDELRAQIFERGLEIPLGMGRIWRVRHSEGKTDRSMPDLAGANADQRVAALTHPNGWVRDTAQRLLLARPGQGKEALVRLAQGDNTVAALHAIWTLAGRDELQRELVLELAARNDTQRQIQALRACQTLLQPEDFLHLAEQLDQAPEAVVMQLIFAMGDHTDDPAIRESMARLLTPRLESPYIQQAVVRALEGQELLFLQEYLASNRLPTESQGGQLLLKTLSAMAYRSLRGDMTSDAAADPQLLQLLALIESRSDANVWQQVAMLAGLESVVNSDSFVPALLDAPPPIFSDTAISEEDPLWNARLRGRGAFTWPGDELAMGIMPLSPEQLQLQALGEAFYPQCGACHGAKGNGTTGLAPPLAGASWVTGPPEWLARIILQGLNGPLEVAGKEWNGEMPAHGHLPELDDATLAGLMTHLRRSWGNKADPVSVETVATARAASADRNRPWTAEELKAVSYDRGYQRFAGEYQISFVTLTVTDRPEGLHLSVPMYGGGIGQQVSETVFQGSAGGESVKLEFLVEADGSVNKMLVYYNGEKLTARRKKD